MDLPLNPISIYVIMGPTASGKTAHAVKLAKSIDAEIVSADSMQIYRSMDIGTAKATKEERDGVPHHMIDIVWPDARFSVARYKEMAEGCIRDILARGRRVIVAGGTGLYISALVYNIQYAEVPEDARVRDELRAEAESGGLRALYRELTAVDPAAAAKIHENDEKRIIRALEVYRLTGTAISEYARRSRSEPPPYNYLLRCLDVPRAELYARIDARVDGMVARGLADEARALFDKYGRDGTASKAIGYKEFAACFDGACTFNEAVEKIKRETRRYAKRQLTWFRSMPGVEWIAP